MRDIDVSSFDKKTGLTTFAIANIHASTGIMLLMSKVSKKILSSTFATKIFTYYGLDLQQIPYYAISDHDIDTIKTMLSSNLQNITSSIQDNTSSNALPTERLASLDLEDLVYDSVNNKIYLKIRLTPVQGDSQSLLFPLDA